MGLDCRGIESLRNLEDIPKKLIHSMKEKFPGGSYHIKIVLWDDYTFRVECRHSEVLKNNELIVHIWQYYEGKFSYIMETSLSSHPISMQTVISNSAR